MTVSEVEKWRDEMIAKWKPEELKAIEEFVSAIPKGEEWRYNKAELVLLGFWPKRKAQKPKGARIK